MTCIFNGNYKFLDFVFLALLFLSSLISATLSSNPFNFEVMEDSNSRFRRSADEQHNFLTIPSNYSIHDLPPGPNGGPAQVNMSIMVTNVRDIKEIGEEISIEMNLRLMWVDSRLSESARAINPTETKFMVLQPNLVDKLWHPDIFIDHVKSISQPIIISRPASLRLYSDSTLRYSTRITVVLSCGMDFHYYPADTQRCNVDVKSYAYSDTRMSLRWRDDGASFSSELDLSNFYVGMDKPDTFSIDTSSGSYSGLRFTILLTRKLSYHLIQTYLPSVVLVVVSWLSFLVNPDSVPGRMTICMTCLLTLISMFAAVRNSTPNVSYVKAIDIWMVVCVFFVFLALMEFTLVLKIKSMKPKKAKDSAPQSQADQSMGTNHFNNMRGSRGSVAHVYYPNQNLPQQRRMSQPRLSLSLPVNEENEMDEYSRPVSEPGGIYTSRPFPPLNRQLHGHLPPLVTQVPPPAVEPPKVPNEYDVAAGRVEIMASVIVPTLFLAFNFVYWPWLIACSEYFAQEAFTIFDS